MARTLLDLMWRDHPEAPRGGRRGPSAQVSTADVVEAALVLADAGGLAEVTVRSLAASSGISTMSVYTHVGSRDDLLALMVDTAHAGMSLPSYGRAGWRTRVTRVAEANRALLEDRPWLLDVEDERVVFGPGTIAKYDHELRALDPLGLDDVTRDAALTFVLDFTRAAARARRPRRRPAEMSELWARWSGPLAGYLGDDFPLARRVGAAAGGAMDAAYSPDHAWAFGLARLLDALDAMRREGGRRKNSTPPGVIPTSTEEREQP